VHAVEELAHLVAGGQGAAGAGLAQLELQRGGMLAQRQVAAVQVQQRAADLRQVAGQGAQLGRADLGQAQVAQVSPSASCSAAGSSSSNSEETSPNTSPSFFCTAGVSGRLLRSIWFR
jgi:hypothetical protein